MASNMGEDLILLGVIGVGAYVLYEITTTTSSTPAATTTTSGPSTSTPATGSTSTAASISTTAVASTNSLNSIYNQIINLITNVYMDTTNFTGSGSSLTGTAYHFDVYLQLAAPQGATIPDPATVFGSESAASQPMTLASYWNSMGPAFAAANPTLGLSGLGLAGLGMFMGRR